MPVMETVPCLSFVLSATTLSSSPESETSPSMRAAGTQALGGSFTKGYWPGLISGTSRPKVALPSKTGFAVPSPLAEPEPVTLPPFQTRLSARTSA